MEKTLFNPNSLFLLKPQNPSNAFFSRPKLLGIAPKVPTIPDISFKRELLTTTDNAVQCDDNACNCEEAKANYEALLQEFSLSKEQVNALTQVVRQLKIEKENLENILNEKKNPEKNVKTVEIQTDEPELSHTLVQTIQDDTTPSSPGEYPDSFDPPLNNGIDFQSVLLKLKEDRSPTEDDNGAYSIDISDTNSQPSSNFVKPIGVPFRTASLNNYSNFSSTDKLQAHAIWLKNFLDVLEKTHLKSKMEI